LVIFGLGYRSVSPSLHANGEEVFFNVTRNQLSGCTRTLAGIPSVSGVDRCVFDRGSFR